MSNCSPIEAMSKHLIVIFAYHYPPDNTIGGARPYRFAKYLSRLGYTCRVFTAADQSGCGDANIEYVPDPFVVGSRHNPKRQVERAVRKFFLPGEVGMHWSYHAFQAARAYVLAHPAVPVTIFSTFPPVGSHLAGWHLARSNKLSWIADCRDPLVDEFTDRNHPPFQARLYRWLERMLAQRADAVIANTDASLVRWREKFPSLGKKFHLIWNGFDPEEHIEPLPVSSRAYKTLSHVGDLYHGRTSAPILDSIARLIAAHRLPAKGVRVRLIGEAQTECLPGPEFVHCAKAEGWLDLVTKRIPRQEALHIAQTSTGLLLLQPQSTDQVPAKIFEYLQIGRPILAFIQPNSPIERILEQSGVPYRCVYPCSSSETVDDVIAGFFDLPSQAVTPGPWFQEQFNAKHQTRALDSIVRGVRGEGPGRDLVSQTPCSGASTR